MGMGMGVGFFENLGMGFVYVPLSV